MLRLSAFQYCQYFSIQNYLLWIGIDILDWRCVPSKVKVKTLLFRNVNNRDSQCRWKQAHRCLKHYATAVHGFCLIALREMLHVSFVHYNMFCIYIILGCSIKVTLKPFRPVSFLLINLYECIINHLEKCHIVWFLNVIHIIGDKNWIIKKIKYVKCNDQITYVLIG